MKKTAFLIVSLVILAFVAQAQSKATDKVLNHYTPDQIEQFTPQKIKKLNYYHSYSYELDFSNIESGKIEKVSKEFDITRYDKHRERSRDNVLSEESTGLIIRLYSWDTVFSFYNTIDLQSQ